MKNFTNFVPHLLGKLRNFDVSHTHTHTHDLDSGSPFMDITPTVNIGGTTSSVNVVTYAWFITEDAQLSPVNEWIAGEAMNHDPTNLRFMSSIHVKNQNLVSLMEEDIQREIVLYPNPTQEVLTVTFEGVFDNPKAEIFNLEGRLIETEYGYSNNSSFIFDVSKLSKGIYLLKLQDKESSITKKFVKK